MEPHELNRMFERLAPSPEQEQNGLDRLLQTERKVKPMRKLKKLTVVGIAAALMIISCAAAVVTGIDQRLADYFRASPEEMELLTPCAQQVDVTAEDNGATLHVTQVLMDRYSILVLADFTAPEGAVLDLGEELEGAYYGRFINFYGFTLLDQEGEPIYIKDVWGALTTILDDDDPLDNRLTLLCQMRLGHGLQPDWEISGLYMPAKTLVRQDLETESLATVYIGDWSCEIPITWQDMGQSIPLNQVVGQLDGTDITVMEVYLSPMTLQIHLENEFSMENWLLPFDTNPVTLTARDGKTVRMKDVDSSGTEHGQNWSFQLDEIIDPDQFRDGTLTISVNGESVDIPLDGLTPVE